MRTRSKRPRAGAARPAGRDALLTREAMHEAIILAAKDAVIAVDDAQNVVLFNPAAEQIFGYAASDMIGESLDRLIPHAARGMHHQYVEQFGARADAVRQMGHDRVVRGLRADGSEFPLDATISTINYHGQRRYVAVVRDVTERVRMANELKASHDSLRELSAALQSIREEEKTRIARELHDELGQALTALKMDASAIAGELAPHQGELIRRANGMKALIDSTVAAVRRISADLRPVMLDSLGLAPTLEWLSRDFEAHSGIKVMLDVPDEDMGAGNDAATAVFRIAQEALTNVARHARARTVRIALAREADALRLTVTDDGVGMADARQGDVRKARSFGLLGMRERATVLGGQFSVKKGPRGGTVVEAVVPADAGAGRSTS